MELKLAMRWTMNPRKSKIVTFAIKRYKLLLAVAVVIIIFVAVSIHIFVDKIPERELARNYILTSEDIHLIFGEVLSVKAGDGGACVSYSITGRVEGYYSFKVKGEIRNGEVRIAWHSKGAGEDFAVDIVELLEPWKDPIVIWSSENR